MTHLLIIRGSDAGISAALRARELDASVEITIVLADSFPNYRVCGLPFCLSGESDWHNLSHPKAEDITGKAFTPRNAVQMAAQAWVKQSSKQEISLNS